MENESLMRFGKNEKSRNKMKKRWNIGDVVRHKEFDTVFVITNTDLYISILGATGYTTEEDENIFNC